MCSFVRAGILAVDEGQTEAARSLGFSPTRDLFSIVVPQAFRIILPPLTNEFIMLFKDSSLVLLLGVTLEERELSKYGRDLAPPKTYEELKAKGLRFVMPPTQREGEGIKLAVAIDPDGLPISFAQMIG